MEKDGLKIFSHAEHILKRTNMHFLGGYVTYRHRNLGTAI